jgi:hypothetical protein
MRNYFRFIGCISALLCCVPTIPAQIHAFERKFLNPRAEVDRAIQQIQDSVSGRLPILEGFVEANDEPLDRFTRGYYQCVLLVNTLPSGGSSVRVNAKITAWYSDPNAAHSGYRVLNSNGRLETDLLDQLEELLAKKSAHAAVAVHTVPATTPSPPPTSGTAVAPNPPLSGDASRHPIAIPLTAPAGALGRIAVSAPEPGSVSPGNETLESLQQRREEAEKRMQKLSEDMKELQEIQRNQTHPQNLAAVRKSGTPVFAKPEPGAVVLFSAESEDEFEVLGLQGRWVHVQIAGVSRGWIRGSDLELPEEISNVTPDKSAREDLSSSSTQPIFRLVRQETHLFAGSWSELQGKTVRIIWVEPSGTAEHTSPQAKRSFAKSLLARTYSEISATNPSVAGVVVVFDSADGGQISATISTLADWQAGKLPEAAFWKQCSLDPPELLTNPAKP